MRDTADYASLFLADAPMIDTRAPAEFARGSFPTAQSLPLMTDDERARVGTCYKQRGQQAAIELGHQLVCGDIKQQRIDAWLDFARQNARGYLYCWRGGLRSQICQQWMREAGCDYPRVQGGYKAMRRFLIDTLESECAQREFVIVGGHTGAAKTALLKKLPNSIDLEGLARHRGSAFGKRPGGQPPQISFENAVAIELLKQAFRFPNQPTVLEDESHLIGQRYLPQCLRDAMQRAPLVLLESDLPSRVEHTFHNYILDAMRERQKCYGQEQGFVQFSEYLRQSLFNLRRRLGGVRYAELQKLLESALERHGRGDADSHRQWIEILLRDYYDPMYSYQLRQKQARRVFAGDANAVLDFLIEDGLREKIA